MWSLSLVRMVKFGQNGTFGQNGKFCQNGTLGMVILGRVVNDVISGQYVFKA